MIIIITNKEDICADFVVQALRQRQAAFWRFNTEDAPQVRFTLTPGQEWSVSLPDGRRILLDASLTGIWYRRPEWVNDAGQRGSAAEFVNDQWRQLIWGLTAVSAGKWVNDPYANQRAECKLLQLQLAQTIGLSTPRTCITNDPVALSDFRMKQSSGAIVKAVYAPLLEDENSFVFTHLLTDEEVPASKELQLAPLICQQALRPKRDIRVTMVGEKVFAAELNAGNEAPIDWRLLPHEGNWAVTELPIWVADKLRELTRRLGLQFAGIDLIHHGGEYYFIEVNPNGEWGWLQTGAGLPIAEALADLLIAPKP